jgi:hypothetical protein
MIKHNLFEDQEILFYILVGAGYITTRGCAPFDSETFDANLQRGMAGTYWKSYDAFSLCENTLCNSSPSIQWNSLLLNIILFTIYVIHV